MLILTSLLFLALLTLSFVIASSEMKEEKLEPILIPVRIDEPKYTFRARRES